jgi:hypothetical protein
MCMSTLRVEAHLELARLLVDGGLELSISVDILGAIDRNVFDPFTLISCFEPSKLDKVHDCVCMHVHVSVFV